MPGIKDRALAPKARSALKPELIFCAHSHWSIVDLVDEGSWISFFINILVI
jgi:hypothetical protein